MKNALRHKIFHHFWSKESGLTNMLILLFISDFVVTPFLTDQLVLKMAIVIFWTLLLITGIKATTNTTLQTSLFSVIPLLFLIINIIPFFVAYEGLDYIRLYIDIMAYCLVIWLVLAKVFENGPVTTHRIIGAVAVYMFIANLWSVIFVFIYDHVPGSFTLPVSEHAGITPGAFLYFSFETLTTTGYGEFLPVHPIARTFAIIEQLIGVMYPVVLIGRLVSLKVVSRD